MRRAVLALVLFLLAIPLAWTLLASVGVTPENSARPPSWIGPPSLDHFAEIGVAEPAFWQELATSSLLSAGAALLALAVALPAAYALARSRLASDRTVAQGLLVLATLPAMAYVIPLSDVMRHAHLLDTLQGVLLAQAAVTAPLAVFVFYGALAQLPVEWEEAAIIDGAGVLRVLLQVVLPLMAPTVAATGIVLFVLDWNMLLAPLVLSAGEVKTLPVAMSDFFTFERELDWPTAAAALMVSLAPLAALVAIFHRVVERFRLTD